MFNRLVTVFAYAPAPQDKFVMVLAPGHPPSLRFGGQSAHLLAIQILHHDKFLASR